ncbi:hypothetical protein QBC43DRAFT_117761 [Cladorrhinum sp. PSN259]|nr:hypothetical protein QBC43DRAFT_117761 [Cladorrhinum sp. PSN259]
MKSTEKSLAVAMILHGILFFPSHHETLSSSNHTLTSTSLSFLFFLLSLSVPHYLGIFSTGPPPHSSTSLSSSFCFTHPLMT